MAEWQPDQEKLSQVGMLLGGCADPSNHGYHVAALQMLDNAKREVPDFGCYLMLVRNYGIYYQSHLEQFQFAKCCNFSSSAVIFIRLLILAFMNEGIQNVGRRAESTPDGWNLPEEYYS
jgi:hypothetical protein